MMESLCDTVAERLALGEPLGELSEHVSSCASCQGLVAVSDKLGAARHAVDPGLGFSARMTVGAQHRITVRRRRRLAAGLAATVATGMFGVFLVAHTAQPPRSEPVIAPPTHPAPDRLPPSVPASDDDIAALASMADIDDAIHLSADWHEIEKPLHPYKKLLKGVTP